MRSTENGEAAKTLAPEKKAAPQRGLRILVVDDNLDQLHTMAHLLRDMGHHVDYAISGIVALELAQRTRPEVIVLDVRLQGEAARLLRASTSTVLN